MKVAAFTFLRVTNLILCVFILACALGMYIERLPPARKVNGTTLAPTTPPTTTPIDLDENQTANHHIIPHHEVAKVPFQDVTGEWYRHGVLYVNFIAVLLYFMFFMSGYLIELIGYVVFLILTLTMQGVENWTHRNMLETVEHRKAGNWRIISMNMPNWLGVFLGLGTIVVMLAGRRANKNIQLPDFCGNGGKRRSRKSLSPSSATNVDNPLNMLMAMMNNPASMLSSDGGSSSSDLGSTNKSRKSKTSSGGSSSSSDGGTSSTSTSRAGKPDKRARIDELIEKIRSKSKSKSKSRSNDD